MGPRKSYKYDLTNIVSPINHVVTQSPKLQTMAYLGPFSLHCNTSESISSPQGRFIHAGYSPSVHCSKQARIPVRWMKQHKIRKPLSSEQIIKAYL